MRIRNLTRPPTYPHPVRLSADRHTRLRSLPSMLDSCPAWCTEEHDSAADEEVGSRHHYGNVLRIPEVPGVHVEVIVDLTAIDDLAKGERSTTDVGVQGLDPGPADVALQVADAIREAVLRAGGLR